ncbi:MAG TPA: hypothetical protein VMZ92_08065 [Planctomycetota bacterium]|nr:hypothetical protein [Planctomycetota bacterium]
MAGSAMVFTETTFGSVKKIVAAWTSDSVTGAVSGTTTFPYDGAIIGLTTIPGTVGDAPDDNYGVTITDVGGHDVLLGAGLLRDTANTEHVAGTSLAGVAGSKLTVSVAAAGASKKGTVIVYVR